MNNGLVDPKRMLIAGEWVQGGEEPLLSINPATGEPNYRVASAGVADVDRAVQSACRASTRSEWVRMLPHQRAAILHRISDGITDSAGRLAELQMLENGKVHAECIAQAKSAAATFRYFAAACETLGSEVTPERGEYLSMTVYEPYGVVVAITPWNSPMTMEAQKVAPALAAGNAVILKPSEITPSTALELGRIALEAGLPAGLLNVLPGTGQLAGKALVEHPGTMMVSFTGGTHTGRWIAQAAASRLIPVALELGGKSPHVVFADANLSDAVGAVIGGIFEGSGQSCVAGSRLFVERSVLEPFVCELRAATQLLRVGLPNEKGSQMGPLASFAHRDRVEQMVLAARCAGAKLVAGGDRPAEKRLASGAFYMPTILDGVESTAAIVREEVFGPVLCVLPFDSEADLVEQANDSAYGLAAGIWTADYRRALRVARQLQAGTVWINTYKQLSISTPFGGFKQSGIGREKGLAGVRLYQQVKGIYLGMGG